MTFFLTPDIASKNTLPIPRDDRLHSSPPRVSLLCAEKIHSCLIVGFQSLQHPIAIPKLFFRRLFKGSPQHRRIS